MVRQQSGRIYPGQHYKEYIVLLKNCCHISDRGFAYNSLQLQKTVVRTVYYRAMLYIRGTGHGRLSVRPSVCQYVCPSQVDVLLKRLNLGSHKQHHTIAQEL